MSKNTEDAHGEYFDPGRATAKMLSCWVVQSGPRLDSGAVKINHRIIYIPSLHLTDPRQNDRCILRWFQRIYPATACPLTNGTVPAGASEWVIHGGLIAWRVGPNPVWVPHFIWWTLGGKSCFRPSHTRSDVPSVFCAKGAVICVKKQHLRKQHFCEWTVSLWKRTRQRTASRMFQQLRPENPRLPSLTETLKRFTLKLNCGERRILGRLSCKKASQRTWWYLCTYMLSVEKYWLLALESRSAPYQWIWHVSVWIAPAVWQVMHILTRVRWQVG